VAEVRRIVARTWTRIVEFDVDRSFSCDSGTFTTANAVVLGQGWSLFSFDFVRNCAVFLRCPVAADVLRAPFVYNAQFEHASDVALVSFDELLVITEQLPDVARLVQFFSTGHCGSTLLHHVFNRVPAVVCISEPIAFNNLALNSAGLSETLKLKLARAALRLLGHYPGTESASCIVVKHFSQSTTQLKLLRDAQPESKNLFLYRDAMGWTNSCYHFVQKYGTAMEVSKDQRSLLWRLLSGGMPENFLHGILDLHGDVVSFDALAAVAWSNHMRHFFSARRDGVALYALRYDELLANRRDALAQLFIYLELPADAVEATLSVFDKDAHEGTRSARDAKDLHFDAENYAVVRMMLAHPKISLSPDLILPTN
jgi:hypothetical protein